MSSFKFHTHSLLQLSTILLLSTSISFILFAIYSPTSLDKFISEKTVTLQNPLLTKIMLAVTALGSGWIFGILTLCLLALLLKKSLWFNLLLAIFSLSLGWLFVKTFKELFHHARPQNALQHLASYSFPSGHAVMSFILFSLVIYCFKNNIQHKIIKFLFITSCSLLILLIGFSRIYLNVHWFSDVLGGFMLGLSIISGVILCLNLFQKSRKEK